jgi:hypothetical protein
MSSLKIDDSKPLQIGSEDILDVVSKIKLPTLPSIFANIVADKHDFNKALKNEEFLYATLCNAIRQGLLTNQVFSILHKQHLLN